MTLEDVQGLSRAMAPVVADAVKAATTPLIERIAQLEKRPTEDAIEERVQRAVRAAVEAIPAPAAGKDGRDGDPGQPGEPGDPGRDGADASEEQIARAVADYMQANPAPAGEKGEPGADGVDGKDGKDADPVAYDDVARAVGELLTPQEGRADPVAAQVQRWLEANPPKDGAAGRDGVDGKDGRDGIDGQKGADGKDGADGTGLAGALIDRAGALVVTLTDGTTRDLGPVVGRDGRDGIDGKDGERGAAGFALTDFEVEQIDLRTLALSFTCGDTKQTYEVALGGFIDRGVYKAGETYELGDATTWGGQLWLAQRETKAAPGPGEDWRLAVKKGRDGKDGRNGKDGERGAPGKDGKSWA